IIDLADVLYEYHLKTATQATIAPISTFNVNTNLNYVKNRIDALGTKNRFYFRSQNDLSRFAQLLTFIHRQRLIYCLHNEIV
ncbi:MAG TPA: hypothetical protein DCR46_02680, partial [Cytophagales bacterium]|nr:hypothetical protein [Cytophagales bacterium]